MTIEFSTEVNRSGWAGDFEIDWPEEVYVRATEIPADPSTGTEASIDVEIMDRDGDYANIPSKQEERIELEAADRMRAERERVRDRNAAEREDADERERDARENP